jgi:pimeloyl-ACP methyl ester carboxylesterase
MPYVINDNLKINYKSVGHGEPLVMLHPNGHCIKDWYTLDYIRQLENHFHLILIDSRGFGDSDKPHDASYYHPRLIANDTIAVLDFLGIEKAHCFGYSMGGRHAFGLMQYYPDRFKSFVIGGAHPYRSNKLLHSYTQLLQQGLPKLVEVFEKNFGSFPPGIKETFLKNDLRALLVINSLPLVDFTAALTNYTENVFFLVGEKDPILKYVQRAQESKKGAKINVVPNNNHMQLFFTARVITAILIDFITSQSPL